MIFIDWVKVQVPLFHKPIKGDINLKLDSSFNLKSRFEQPKELYIPSSDSKVYIQTVKGVFKYGHNPYKPKFANEDDSLYNTDDYLYGSVLQIECCPNKFINGHNLWGYSNINTVVFVIVKRLIELFPEYFSNDLPCNLDNLKCIYKGIYSVMKLDITGMYKVGNNSDEVNAFIRNLSADAEMIYRGKGLLQHNTLYFGKNSKKWAIKIYNKEVELKANDPDNITAIKHSQGYARIEMRFLSKELTNEKVLANKLRVPFLDATPLTIHELFYTYGKGLKMSDNSKNILSTTDIENLSNAYRATYLAWKGGIDIKPPYMKRRTFYNHKKYFLDNYNINIAVPRDEKELGKDKLELSSNDVLDSLKPYIKNAPDTLPIHDIYKEVSDYVLEHDIHSSPIKNMEFEYNTHCYNLSLKDYSLDWVIDGRPEDKIIDGKLYKNVVLFRGEMIPPKHRSINFHDTHIEILLDYENFRDTPMFDYISTGNLEYLEQCSDYFKN